ncbi:phosphoribosylamine--glycine ligase [Oceanobacillus luteolus]|uniref:Phosphoribosylamine--glycine ligase n=1 Tax=Oceanobacillus luteolus TaxID=1274358 RepID=A0ABW4HN85_9BACI|nr:phosphoribosylamine--glycine ligase [Oceanobacillus luteolus]MCM3739408.1 phosphoribosylamine--glycine ligase [Oceanobacillus luteolus]
MNVLVVGRGGREHSIVTKLGESKQVSKIFAAPGNAGIAKSAECVAIDEMDIDGLVAFAKEQEIDLTVVGPENPLNAGIADRFQEAGLKIFAPSEKAALLEGSKSYAKEFMQKYDVPTAAYAVFSDPEEAKAYIRKQGAPIVVKADGLAAGKGVIVALTEEEALDAVDDMLVSKAFAEAGATVVIEEFLDGKEFSLMAFVHEDKVFPMVTARDHKRAFDNDEGPNTGGMGAFAPADDVTQADLDFAMENILLRTANGMIKEGRPFTGILYAGLIMTAQGPKVIEFNTRFGDPETQVVLPLLKNDLYQVFHDVLDGNDPELVWEDAASLGVVIASQGYPGSYKKGVQLPELPEGSNPLTVHAGTKLENGELVSDGGRVLLVGAVAATREEAAGKVYDALKIFDDTNDFFYRKDIGK